MPRSHGLFSRLVSGAAVLFFGLFVGRLSPASDLVADQLRKIDQEWRAKLGELADKCDGLQLPEPARVTRELGVERDPRRQYLFLPARPDAIANKDSESELVSKWRMRLEELRREHANKLFSVAEGCYGEDASTAYRLLHEVLFHDPAHAEAKRIMRVAGESRPRARQQRIPHSQIGWPRGGWWQVESPHFQVTTDAGQAAGIEVAERLEEFHAVWRQVFFEYWSSPAWLRSRWKGEASPAGGERRHQIVLFRNREGYLRYLTPQEPKIGVTLGYYFKRARTSYFHAGSEDNWPVWFHEAAHQMFQETGDPVADVGEKWNFWVVEGIATYLESLRRDQGFYVLGGFDSDRLQFTRSRVMGGDRLLPWPALSALGREDLQQHADIRRLYTQSAGLAHWLMDGEGGRWRTEFLRRITTTYQGTDSARTYLDWPGVEDLDASLRQFLVVRDEDLRFLGPVDRRRNLSLARAEITDESLKHLAGSNQLEWLDLAYTPIGDVGLRALETLPKLRRLTLVNTRVTDEGASVLAEWPTLEELDLSGTRMGDAALARIGSLRSLQVLRLAHTQVTDAGLEHLRGLVNLQELDLDQTSVTAEARARLKQIFPKLEE